MDDKAIEVMARGVRTLTFTDMMAKAIAQAALAAYHAHLKAEGFAIVPVEDVHRCMAWIGSGPAECELHDRLEAMIAAAGSDAPNPNDQSPA